jgi:membrane associated rhomboid family serine protease
MSEPTTSPTCYRHPDRETYLSCSECGRPICPDCSHDAPVGQKCPECVRAAGRQKIVHGRTLIAGPTFQTSPVAFSLIAINVLIFIIGMSSRELFSELVSDFSSLRLFPPGGGIGAIGIEAGEWWRALTSAFLHDGFMHVVFNMYFLYIFGPRLEQQVKSGAFAGIYLASAAGGSLASYLFGPASVPSIGASGALFGLFGAWLYAAYRQRGSAAGKAMFNQLGAILLINLALPLFIPRIDWRGHMGGLVTGIVVAFLWERLVTRRFNARVMRTAVAFAVLAAILATLIVL